MDDITMMALDEHQQQHHPAESQSHPQDPPAHLSAGTPEDSGNSPSFNLSDLAQQMPVTPAATSNSVRECRELSVKMHIRRPGRDAWTYVGRAVINTYLSGQTSRVVVRNAASEKVLAIFSAEHSAIQADKRGTFIVVASVEASGVISYSLNCLNNSDALRLLASIELACHKSTHGIVDPKGHSKYRRRIEKVIKDDRRRRHKRRKEEDELVAAFDQQKIA